MLKIMNESEYLSLSKQQTLKIILNIFEIFT